MLELRGVTRVYETGGLVKKALDRVTINFRVSEFVAILGPSGSGKTTLLNIIGGLDHYTDGELKINEISTRKFRDKDWDAYRNHRIGFVFQSYNLIPHQTVLANVKLALTLSGISKHEATARAKKTLADVGLSEHINKRPAQLSGGQMQRVAIARALVNDPDILLADEPTGALDSETSVQIMNLLKEIAKDKLVIMVTHNPELAEEYATRIVTLKDGRITSDSDLYNGKVKTKLPEKDANKKQRRTKMSFFTALTLSLKNLLTKKARTILVALAGSIGIIGIALILAVSTGFQAYIDTIERDTLTSYPLTLTRESTNVSGMLLGVLGSSGDDTKEGSVVEAPMITSMLDNSTTNDLKNFQKYLENHYDEVKDDIRLVENKYNVDPLIYTIDTTGALTKANPSNLFSSLMGDSILTASSYSSLTSAFTQYDRTNMENDLELIQGKLPEKYNELLLYLPNKGQISDYLTYSLGFHDSAKLSEAITKMLTGEKTEFESESLTISYDDLLGVDLRLINPADTYKYNSTYNIYEDMSGDAAYMMEAYDRAEPLKIVGIATEKEGTLTTASGILYLPSLPEHVISEAAKTAVVKQQLKEPSINVFMGRKFGDKGDTSLEFSDLVSVDTSKIQRAFSFNLDSTELKNKALEYTKIAAEDLAKQILDELKAVEPLLNEKAEEVSDKIVERIKEKVDDPEIDIESMDREEVTELISGIVEDVIADTDFSELATKIQDFDIEGKIDAKIDGLVKYLSTTIQGAFSVNEQTLMSAFTLNFSEEELARLMATMFDRNEATLSSNLSTLGYQDLEEPSRIAFYFSSFDGKTNFMKFLDGYNDMMQGYGQDEKVIEYTDITGTLMSSVKTIVDAVSYVLIAFVSISLVVSSIMIGVITYISVYERTKEIGILRAIGASKHNISSIFNAETFIIGLLSGLLGIGISYLLIPIINLILHHFTGEIPLSAQLDPVSALILIGLSVVLTLIGGLIPAKSASKKDPVEALRAE